MTIFCERHPRSRTIYSVTRGPQCLDCAKGYRVNGERGEGPAAIAFEGRGSERFFELLREAWQLHQAKSDDYGSGEDPLANFVVAADLLGCRPSDQALALLAAKVARLKRLVAKQRQATNEPFADSVRDLAAYCFLLLELLEREA